MFDHLVTDHLQTRHIRRLRYSYRTLTTSIISLLRMAVGDFDYEQLQQSQQLLGPLMFWVYIILVFFVLMSMFIALISEACEYTMRGE